jgi:hypothetical protein
MKSDETNSKIIDLHEIYNFVKKKKRNGKNDFGPNLHLFSGELLGRTDTGLNPPVFQEIVGAAHSLCLQPLTAGLNLWN